MASKFSFSSSLALILALIITISIITPTITADSVYVDGEEVQIPNDGQPPFYHYMDIPDTKTFGWTADYSPFNIDTKDQVSYYAMNVTSLQWLTIQDVDLTIWKHRIVIIKPDNIINQTKAILYITRCSNQINEKATECFKTEISFATNFVKKTGLILAMAFNVPNQAVIFTSDPKQLERTEDRLVGFTWEKFMAEERTRPDWIAYFPMAKASMRCMDAVEQWSQKMIQLGKLTEKISSWYIVGVSKRGATTWFLSAYLGAKHPERIFGSAPVVYDSLNFKEVVLGAMPSKLGGFTSQFEPYREALPLLLKPQARDLLLTHIDLATEWYRAGLSNVPKYIVSGALDEFFLLGNDRYWYDLVENKHRLTVPNANHSFILGSDWLFAGIASHLKAIMSHIPLPHIIDKVDHKKGTIMMCADVKPTSSALYRGTPNRTEPQRLDYRMMKIKIPGGCFPPAVESGTICINITDFKTTKLPIIQNEDGKWCSVYHEEEGLKMGEDYAQNGNLADIKWFSSYIVMSWDEKSPIGSGVYNTPVLIMPDIMPFGSCLDETYECPVDNFI